MTKSATTTAEIRGLEDVRYAAMVAADVATLERLLDDDLVYTHSSGIVDGKQSYLQGVGDGTFDYRAIDRSDEAILTRGDHVLISNTCRMDLYVSGVRKALHNYVLTVWSRVDDGPWRMVALHSTPVAKADGAHA